MKSMFSQARRWVSAVAVGLSLLGSGAQAGPLYTQAPNSGPTGDIFLSLDSQQNADSFSLGYAASLTSLNFYGTNADLASLVVRLYPVAAGTLPANSTTGTAMTGTITRGASPLYTLVGSTASFPVYEFTLTLDTAYTTAADQTFYLSIFSTDNWAWASSADGDGFSTYRDADGTPWQTPVSPDLAFAINGDRIIENQTPEPASLALVGMALFAAGYARRRSA